MKGRGNSHVLQISILAEGNAVIFVVTAFALAVALLVPCEVQNEAGMS
jgi:hypothetical protein